MCNGFVLRVVEMAGGCIPDNYSFMDGRVFSKNKFTATVSDLASWRCFPHPGVAVVGLQTAPFVPFVFAAPLLFWRGVWPEQS